jgi:hypothetical protein
MIRLRPDQMRARLTALGADVKGQSVDELRATFDEASRYFDCLLYSEKGFQAHVRAQQENDHDR